MFLNDEPISNIKDDILNRNEFVSRLGKTIINWEANESLVIGIYGPWGSGKSSVLNLLQAYIESMENKDASIVIKFDPWYFNSTEQLLVSFFSTINSAIKKLTNIKNPELDKYFSKYSNILTFSISPEISIGPVKFSVPIKKINQDDSPNKIKKSIVNAIEKINGQIIIMIDNMDRLEPNELMLMFKLVRLCNDFPNFIYILAFDQKQVIKILETQKNIESQYLKKIIQVDINLPSVDQNQVDSFVYSGINNIINQYKLNFEQSSVERFVSVYQKNVPFFIPDLRTAKRYLNAITFSIPLIKNEVNYCDFLLLEFIRVFEFNIYNELPKYETELTSFDSDSVNSSDYVRKEKFNIYSNLRKIINDKVEKERVTLIENILGNLFPMFGAYISNPTNPMYITNENKRSYERDLRITTTTHFSKFFRLRLSSNEIPKTLIDNFIQLLDNDQQITPSGIIDILNHYQKNRNLMNFFDKLLLYEMNISIEGKRTLIEAIIGMSNNFAAKTDVFWKSEERSAINLLLSCLKSQDSITFEKLFEDSVNNAKSLPFSILVFSKVVNAKNQEFPEIKNIEIILSGIKNRIHKLLLEEKKDVFYLYPDGFSTIFSIWKSENYLNEREIANNYIYGVLKENSKAIYQLLSQYFWRTLDGKLSDFNYPKFCEEYDINIINQIIDETSAKFTDEEEKFVINEVRRYFLRYYDSISENES